MRVYMALLAATLSLSAAPANADDILAGGAVPGNRFICTIYNSQNPAVTLSNLQIRDEKGDPILFDDESTTCKESRKLAAGKSCAIVATALEESPLASCRVTVSPSKKNVRGALFGASSMTSPPIIVSTDLR